MSHERGTRIPGMKMLPALAVVVLAVIAGIVPRFWLRMVAAGLSALVGLSLVVAAYDWWRRVAAGTAGTGRGFDPPGTPVVATVAAIFFMTLAAVLAWLAEQARGRGGVVRSGPAPGSTPQRSVSRLPFPPSSTP